MLTALAVREYPSAEPGGRAAAAASVAAASYTTAAATVFVVDDDVLHEIVRVCEEVVDVTSLQHFHGLFLKRLIFVMFLLATDISANLF